MSVAEGGERGEDVGSAVAEGEEGDGGHAGREVEVRGEFSSDDGEVVLCGGDEDVEVEEEEECEGRDSERGVVGEDAVVVEKAIGFGGAI